MDGQLGMGSGEYGAVVSGLSGLVKTAKVEWPEVFCRFIDAAVFLTVMKACRRKTFSPSSRFNEPDGAEAGLRLIKPPIFPCLDSRSFRED